MSPTSSANAPPGRYPSPLTDHNTVRGWTKLATGFAGRIEFVPGIEIDCSFEGTDLHLLGYGID